MKSLLVYILIITVAVFFFSYRLSEVPSGLTIDESAFGYNAALLSKTLHDENNRPLPIFVLSINGKDWRQPVMQYLMVVVFKILGPSYYDLKFTSVLIASFSTLLIFILGKKLFDNIGAIFSLIIFATIPILMIHSHLGLDNIAPIPLIILWLIFLYKYEKTKSLPAQASLKYLIISALFLGIGFYSHKSMRSFTTVWAIITLIYLITPILKKPTIKGIVTVVKAALTFFLTILPFYLIIPLLEYKYAGAVLGQTSFNIDSLYKFFLSYLASFDPSFLFVTGDEILHHSTGRHGMFLLTSLPFFLIGSAQALKKDKFWIFILVSFFLGPLLFGLPGSYHRASRLMALVPLYSLLSGLGMYYLWKNRSKFIAVFIVLIILFGINYLDFIKYYWFSYTKDTYNIFYHSNADMAYKLLFEESKKRNLKPYVTSEIIKKEKTDEGIQDAFYRATYFPYYPGVWYKAEKDLPDKSILMSLNSAAEDLTPMEESLGPYYFYTKN